MYAVLLLEGDSLEMQFSFPLITVRSEIALCSRRPWKTIDTSLFKWLLKTKLSKLNT